MWPYIAMGAGMLGQSILGFFGQRQTNKTNVELAKQAQIYDRSMWDLQNQYNDPLNQMSRLKAAGLNPMMVYGGGNVTGNTTSSAPKAHIPEYQSPMSKIDISGVVNILNAYQQYQLTEAQIEKVKYDAQISDIQGWLLGQEKGFRADLFNQEYADYIKSKYLGGRVDYDLKMQQYQGINPQIIRSYKINNDIKNNDLTVSNSLKPYNMSITDPIWARLFKWLLDQTSFMK